MAMTSPSRSLPMLVAVALVAFLLGSLGTAVAGPGLTEKAVAKIAGKVVKKKAPKLTVKNSKKLAGRPPATYLDRVAYSSTLADGIADAGDFSEIVAPISITIPPGVNFVRVTGNASFGGTASLGTLWYAVDDTSCPDAAGVGYSRRVQLSVSPTRDNATIDSVEPLTGTHTFRLCARASTEDAAVYNANLTVVTVAANGTGGSTARQTGAGTGSGGVTKE